MTHWNNALLQQQTRYETDGMTTVNPIMYMFVSKYANFNVTDHTQSKDCCCSVSTFAHLTYIIISIPYIIILISNSWNITTNFAVDYQTVRMLSSWLSMLFSNQRWSCFSSLPQLFSDTLWRLANNSFHLTFSSVAHLFLETFYRRLLSFLSYFMSLVFKMSSTDW